LLWSLCLFFSLVFFLFSLICQHVNTNSSFHAL
jgi:hypothetical protein